MRKRILVCLLAFILLLAGCGQTPQTENSQTESEVSVPEETAVQTAPVEEPEPAEGGELRLAISYSKSLLPWEVTDPAAADMLMLIYSPLLEMDAEGRMQPCLAQSWSWSEENPAEMILQLREGVTFQNGKTLTAADVVYSIQKLQSAQNAFSGAVQGIAQAQALDESRVRLLFSAPGRMNEEGLIFPIVPEGYAEKQIPMGTGPYRYQSGKSMRELVLTRNESYFGASPYIDSVRVYLTRDADAVVECFETTRTNLMHRAYFEWGSYVNQTNLTVHSYDSYEAVYLEFNTNSTFGASVSNREKTAYAVDAVRVLRDAYWGKGTVTETLIRPGSWYKEDSAKQYGYDAEKALNMAAEGTDTVRLLYSAQDPVLSAAAETVCNQLKAAGLQVTPVTSGSYDIALRRGRMTLMEAARVTGQQGILAEARTDAEVRAAAVQLDSMMQSSLKVYGLFFLTQASVSGYGTEGELTPNDWHVYSGAEQLYMTEEARQ